MGNRQDKPKQSGGSYANVIQKYVKIKSITRAKERLMRKVSIAKKI